MKSIATTFWGFVVAAGLSFTDAALAQHDDAIAMARSGVAGLGKQWNGEVNAATRALYVEVQRQTDSSGIRQISDVSYGPHDLQKFDLFVSDKSPDDSGVVLIYVHGGGLVAGDKVGADGLLYSNVGKFIARHGGVGINMNYRLAPEVTWPAGAEDIRMVLDWVRENIESYEGDPEKVFLMGNSAGSAHVAAYLFHEASQLEGGPGIVGAILASGGFSASGSSQAARAYYGESAFERETHGPLGLVDSYEGAAVPLFLWSAEYDPASIETSVAEMYVKLCRKYRDCPIYTQFQGFNHVSHVMSIDSADTEVSDAVMSFIDSVVGSR